MSDTQATLALSEGVDSEQPSQALTDLRHGAMSLPVETQQRALAEYAERRASFRDWLLSQLQVGLHFGYPPGTEPNLDDDGNMIVGRGKVVPKTSWRKVPSLYQAGADFICDLMGWRHEFEADETAWKMMGEKEFNFCYRCRLLSRENGAIAGDGHGAAKSADHQGSVNTAVKMACKRAKVAAVINALGLSDLFTQDIEDMTREPNPAPAQNDNAPTAKTRKERQREPELDGESIAMLFDDYRKFFNYPQYDRGTDEHKEQRRHFFEWVKITTQRDFDPSKLINWTKADYDKCCEALGVTF